MVANKLSASHTSDDLHRLHVLNDGLLGVLRVRQELDVAKPKDGTQHALDVLDFTLAEADTLHRDECNIPILLQNGDHANWFRGDYEIEN